MTAYDDTMRGRTTTQWMALSFAVALAIVLVVRLGAAPGERLGTALRATARWSFLLFWPASAGDALATLFGERFKALARRGRDFGLAFASAHVVHLGLVAWLYYSSVKAPVSRSTLIFFGVAALWTYALAILSIQRLSAKLDPRTWRIVRAIGVEYISLAFLVDFARNPFHGGAAHLAAYVPFLALAAAGPLLRLVAATKRLGQSRALLARL
jgi:hypothetical protein